MTVTVRIVAATGAIRKMRGGTQAHLLEGRDGGHYVVKFLNNPQHRRILVNEFLSSIIIGHLGLQAPATAFVAVTEGFLFQHPDVYLQLKSGRIRPTVGLHFGSAYPGNPSKTAVYDFLPDTLLARKEEAAVAQKEAEQLRKKLATSDYLVRTLKRQIQPRQKKRRRK